MDVAYDGVRSKVGKNLKIQNKARAESADLQARKAMRFKNWCESGDDSMNQLIADLSVSYEDLGRLPRRADISPERQEDFNKMYEEITKDLE